MARQLLNTDQKDPHTSTLSSYLKEDFKKSLPNDDLTYISDPDKAKADINVSSTHYS